MSAGAVSLSGEAAAFLATWSGSGGEQLRMLPVGSRALADELRALEGVTLYAMIADTDFEVIEDEMFDDGFDEGIWISPVSGEEVGEHRIVFYADLKEAADRGLHGLGLPAAPAPGA